MGPDTEPAIPARTTDLPSAQSEDSPQSRLAGHYGYGVTLGLLVLAALLLRVHALELISFRYDSAAAYDRARSWFDGGQFPWTGIENSLGFHNSGALIWLLMIPASLSRWPEAMAGFQGLLWALAVIPMAGVARILTGSRSLAILAAALFAFLPSGIFAARGIWAQNILPPLFAWSLYHALRLGQIAGSSDTTDRLAVWHVLGAMAPAWYGALIHMAAGIPALLLTLWILLQKPVKLGTRLLVFAPVSIAVLLAIPSLWDGWSRFSNPLPAEDLPAHLTKFQSQMPPVDHTLVRMHQMLVGIPSPLGTLTADGGLHELLPEGAPLLYIGLTMTLLTTLASLAGLAVVLMATVRGNSEGFAWKGVSGLLLFLILIPPVVCALALSRPNASYLTASYPVLILLMVHGIGLLTSRAQRPRWINLAVSGLVVLLLIPGSLYAPLAQAHARTCDPPWPKQGPYYLPLTEYRRVAAYLANQGIGPDSIHHISGDYFQLSYEVLLRRMPKTQATSKSAILEDIPLRGLIDEGHAQWLAQRATHRIGTVALILLPDARTAEAALQEYYRLPKTPPNPKALPLE